MSLAALRPHSLSLDDCLFARAADGTACEGGGLCANGVCQASTTTPAPLAVAGPDLPTIRTSNASMLLHVPPGKSIFLDASEGQVNGAQDHTIVHTGVVARVSCVSPLTLGCGLLPHIYCCVPATVVEP